MNALTKANRMIQARMSTFREQAGHMKAEGSIGDVMAPSDALGGFGQFKSQAKMRERYGRFRGVVYAAVNATSLYACGQPVRVAKLSGEKRAKPSGRKSMLMRKMPADLRAKSADNELEIIEDHPLVRALEKPNPHQGRLQFVYNFVANLCLTGKAYIVGSMSGDGDLELYSLPTTWVDPKYGEDGLLVGWKVGDPSKPQATRATLDPNQVVCAYLPDPGDPRGSLAPAASQIGAIRVDDKIWQSREVFFDNNTFPGVIITVGKQPMMDTEKRPMLTSAQRRQLDAAITSQMKGVHNYGKPAIIDGLIERIDRLQMNSQEMGWEKSAKETKSAILSAFCVHPFILGEQMAVGTQQAAVIWRLFYDRLNVYLGMLGNAVSQFINGMGGDELLMVWWEEKEYVDPDAQWKRTVDLRRLGDIGQNESRAAAGFPPDEDMNEDVLGKYAKEIREVLRLQGDGKMMRDQVVAYLIALGLPTDHAENIAGDGSHAPPAAIPGGSGSEYPPVGEGPQEGGEGQERAVSAEALLADAVEQLRKPSEDSDHIAETICRASEIAS